MGHLCGKQKGNARNTDRPICYSSVKGMNEANGGSLKIRTGTVDPIRYRYSTRAAFLNYCSRLLSIEQRPSS